MTINSWGAPVPVSVAKGGTGRTSLDDEEMLIGDGTNPIQSLPYGSDGQLLIGTTASLPAWTTPTATANQISLLAAAGSVTLGLADNTIWPGDQSLIIQSGSTGARPSPVNGMIRWNTSLNQWEGVENSVWVPFTTSTGLAWEPVTFELVGSTVLRITVTSGISALYRFSVSGRKPTAATAATTVLLRIGSTTTNYASISYSPSGTVTATNGGTLFTYLDEANKVAGWEGFVYIPNISGNYPQFWGNWRLYSGATTTTFTSGAFSGISRTSTTTATQINFALSTGSWEAEAQVSSGLKAWRLLL